MNNIPSLPSIMARKSRQLPFFPQIRLNHTLSAQPASKKSAFVPYTKEKLNLLPLPKVAMQSYFLAKNDISNITAFKDVAESLTSPNIALNTLEPKTLALMTWGFAKANLYHDELFSLISRAITSSNLDKFPNQSIVNILWSFSRLEVQDEALYECISQYIIDNDLFTELDPQGFSNTIYAFSKLPNVNQTLVKSAIAAIEARPDFWDKFKPQEMSNTLLAFARLNQHGAFFDTASESIISRKIMSQFTQQAVGNTTWAFARANCRNIRMFAVISQSVKTRMEEFEIDTLCSIVWAFAKMDVKDKSLFMKIADYLKADKEVLSKQSRDMLVWAYDHVGIQAEEVSFLFE
jgi:hypothetical protein